MARVFCYISVTASLMVLTAPFLYANGLIYALDAPEDILAPPLPPAPVGDIGQSVYADVDGEGTPDLVSLRSGNPGVSVFYQVGNPALSETVIYSANASTPVERLTDGNFSGSGSVEFAISGTPEVSGVPVFRLTSEAPPSNRRRLCRQRRITPHSGTRER